MLYAGRPALEFSLLLGDTEFARDRFKASFGLSCQKVLTVKLQDDDDIQLPM